MNQIAYLSAPSLRALIDCPSAELALLDVSEEGQFGERHLLHAVNVPYSLLERFVTPLVPRLATPIVLIDHGANVAERAATRLASLGYSDLVILTGGVDAWAAQGYALFEGVHVHSKAFGEWLERACDTPSISAADLHSRMLAGEPTVVLDPRTTGEYAARHVPGALSAPSQELLKMVDSTIHSPDTLVVVACGGRTRGIVGAQNLIDARVPNRVVALDGGNHNWQLAGFAFERGLTGRPPASASHHADAATRAASMRERFEIPSVTVEQVESWLTGKSSLAQTTYVFDVRLPDEYAAGHYRHAKNAPGGQLVQATDRWLATRGARVVLVDDDGVRAVPTALRLRQMGWNAQVLTVNPTTGSSPDSSTTDNPATGEVHIPDPDKAAYVRRLSGTVPRVVPEIRPHDARAWLASNAAGVSFDPSSDYLERHPAGFEWANRVNLDHLVERLRGGQRLVLFSSNPDAAHLAGSDLLDAVRLTAADGRLAVLSGGLEAWIAAGWPVSRADPDSLDRSSRIDYLFWLHRRRYGDQQAMRDYLAWEHALLGQIEASGEPFPSWPR
jgi:rhodanese-related sulfurtransferase